MREKLQDGRGSPAWKRPLTLFFCAAGILLAVLIAYSAWEAGTISVTAIVDHDAPEGIVFISDPHAGPGNIDHARAVVTEINRLNPSIVLIGGDFGWGRFEDPAFLAVWGELDAPAYAVLGNHDYLTGIRGSGVPGRIAWILESVLRSRGMDTRQFYPGDPDSGQADAIARSLGQNGIRVLRNEAVELSLNGTRTIIVGSDDLWAGRAEPPAIPDTDAYIIYLVHEPLVREEWNADLVLSGHTHGGQVSHPLLSLLEWLDVADIRGLSWKGAVPLYTSRGIGTSAFPHDYRFLTPPEIVIINPSGGIKPGWAVVSLD